MRKGAIKWLYQQLPELVSKGIISQEASAKIRAYYGEIKRASKVSVAVIVCGSIGALLVGLGIILLIAHNWEQLSRAARAVISFLPLVIAQMLAGWVLLKRPKSDALKEGTATFLSLMVGASIALISQTYNIPEDPNIFIFTWMFLVIPLAYLMQATMPAIIYLIGITFWAGSYWDNPAMAALFWPMALVAMPHFIWALRQETYALRTAIFSLVVLVCCSSAMSFSLGKNWSGSWIILFPSLYAIFYLLGSRKFEKITDNWQRPLRFVGAIALFIISFIFTFQTIWKLNDYMYESSGRVYGILAMPDYFISFIIVVTAALLFYDSIKRKDYPVALFGAIPLLAIIAYIFKDIAVLPTLIFNIYIFILSVSRIMLGIRNNSLGMVNVGMLMLAALIIARFFDSDISFVMKGLVFIIVGIGFLVANIFFARRKRGAE